MPLSHLKQRNRYAGKQQYEIHSASFARIIDTTDNACKLDEAILLMLVPCTQLFRVLNAALIFSVDRRLLGSC